MASGASVDDIWVANCRKDERHSPLHGPLMGVGLRGSVDIRSASPTKGAVPILLKRVNGVQAFEGLGKRKDFEVGR